MAHDKKTYSLSYDRLAVEELSGLDIFWQGKILMAIENKLRHAPEIFGKPLRQSLRGCRSLRVGDYRVVFQIDKKAIRVIAIVYRSGKYKGIDKRI